MISVGLIGCGEVAESGHLPTILKSDRFRLAAVCDVDPTRTELFSQRAGGVPQYCDWRESLARRRAVSGRSERVVHAETLRLRELAVRHPREQLHQRRLAACAQCVS